MKQNFQYSNFKQNINNCKNLYTKILTFSLKNTMRPPIDKRSARIATQY